MNEVVPFRAVFVLEECEAGDIRRKLVVLAGRYQTGQVVRRRWQRYCWDTIEAVGLARDRDKGELEA